MGAMPYPGQAAPQKSGLDTKVIVGLVAGVVVLIAVVAVAVWMTMRAGFGEPTFAQSPSETSAVETPEGVEETQAASVGQEVRDGNFSFVVAGVERAEAVADPEFPDLRKEAQGEYLIVKVTVTNVGDEPQAFFAAYNTLSDGTTTYQSDDEAWIYLGNTLADLNPGDSIDTAVVFDVPDGTDPESIELHDGPFSDGVTVGL